MRNTFADFPVCNNRQSHFFAYLVRNLTNFLPGRIMFGIHECTKRSVIFHIGFAENNVIMDMVFVRMRGKNILILTLKEFVAEHQSCLMYMFRCCFIRCKTLYDMITQNTSCVPSHTSQFAELVRNLSCISPAAVSCNICCFLRIHNILDGFSFCNSDWMD